MNAYTESYLATVNLDALPVKRPKKIQCKPGFVQRGAACQKKGTAKSAKPSAEGGGTKNLLLTAAAVGISTAAVAAAIKQNPQFVEEVDRKTKDFLKAMDKPAPKELSEKAQSVVDKTSVEIDKKIGDKPSKLQQLGKEVAIEVASKAVGVLAGNLTMGGVFAAGAEKNPMGALGGGLVGGLVVGRATRIATRHALYGAFGESGISNANKKNLRIALDVAYIGSLFLANAAVASKL